MKGKVWLFSALVAMAAASGVMLLSREVLVLELGNTDRLRTVQVRIAPSDRFSISYIHSMYREAVTEEFETDGNGILLNGMRTKSSAVREYYRIEESKDFHPIRRRLGPLFLRVGEGEGQTLAVRNRTILFSRVGRRGDRVRLGVRPVSLARYLLLKLIG